MFTYWQTWLHSRILTSICVIKNNHFVIKMIYSVFKKPILKSQHNFWITPWLMIKFCFLVNNNWIIIQIYFYSLLFLKSCLTNIASLRKLYILIEFVGFWIIYSKCICVCNHCIIFSSDYGRVGTYTYE